MSGAVLRAPGMDHEIYRYSRITDRPALPLDGCRIAVYLVLQLEYWELCPPADSYREPRFKGEYGTYAPEFRNWTTREYGNRVGVYRILDLLDKAGISPTVAFGAALVQTHPELMAEVRARGWEVAGHGFSSNRMITSRMTQAQEREFIATSRRIVSDAFGMPLQGWLSQDFGITPRTSDLLREHGFSYTLDWANDALPYWQNAGGVEQGLMALPAPTELDDVQTIGLRRILPERFPGMVRDALLGASDASHPSVLAIGVHPWMLGAAHRIRYLRETLEVLRSRPDVLITTAGDIARRFQSLTRE